MPFQYLKFDTANGVATITLNRPGVYNALNDEITYERCKILQSKR